MGIHVITGKRTVYVPGDDEVLRPREETVITVLEDGLFGRRPVRVYTSAEGLPPADDTEYILETDRDPDTGKPCKVLRYTNCYGNEERIKLEEVKPPITY